MRVLLTRPEAQSRRFAGEIEARFGGRFEVVISALVEIRFLPVRVNWQAYDGLVFTSQNGVAAASGLGAPQGMKAYCVGSRTMQAARAAGLDAVSADGDVRALNAVLARDAAGARLAHLSGAQVAGEVAGRVTRITAYEQVPKPLSDEARQYLRQPDPLAMCLFSPQVARWASAALEAELVAPVTAICLSQAVADALDHTLFSRVEPCGQPCADAMLDKMSDIFPP